MSEDGRRVPLGSPSSTLASREKKDKCHPTKKTRRSESLGRLVRSRCGARSRSGLESSAVSVDGKLQLNVVLAAHPSSLMSLISIW